MCAGSPYSVDKANGLLGISQEAFTDWLSWSFVGRRRSTIWVEENTYFPVFPVIVGNLVYGSNFEFSEMH